METGELLPRFRRSSIWQPQYPETTDIFSKHFHWLRDFTLDHPEAGVIFQAID